MAGNFELALKVREAIRAIVQAEVDRMRPQSRRALVMSIDRVNYKCAVRFVGESTNITVNMGAIQPRTTGQYVRIESMGADKYVADVYGPPYIWT
jgi:hypothetical protein